MTQRTPRLPRHIPQLGPTGMRQRRPDSRRRDSGQPPPLRTSTVGRHGGSCGKPDSSLLPNMCRNRRHLRREPSSADVCVTVYKTAAQPAFMWRDGRPTRAQQTETDVLFGGAVTTATGSCVCSRRTPGWARNQCGRSTTPRSWPSWGGPWLNHSSTTPSNTAAMQLSAQVEALTLRPGQTRDPLGPPDSRNGISDRSLSRRARSLCTMLDLGF